MVVLHPTLDPGTPHEMVSRAASDAGVALVAPVYMEYPDKYYSDGYHLNHIGMENFTNAIVVPLEERLQKMKPRIFERKSLNPRRSAVGILSPGEITAGGFSPIHANRRTA